jgi:L-asparaginase II
VRLRAADIASDGCGAPAVCLQLEDLARGLATLLADGPTEPGGLILQAMTSHPRMIGGRDHFDSVMMDRAKGLVISKIGADGVHVALVRELQLCIAVKAVSGSSTHAQFALLRLLRELGALPDEQFAHWATRVMTDDGEQVVGEIRVS